MTLSHLLLVLLASYAQARLRRDLSSDVCVLGNSSTRDFRHL